jgi:hypothetical protein
MVGVMAWPPAMLGGSRATRRLGEHQEAPWRAPARGGSGGLTEEVARRAMAERMRRDGVQMQWGGGGSRWLAMTRLQSCTLGRERGR